MLEEKILEVAPLAYLRGRTFKDSIVILDESQLTTTDQMKMVLTRIGEGSRMFITGDVRQRDGDKEGLVDFIARLKDYGRTPENLAFVKFDHRHIERSEIVRTVLDIYGDED